MDDRIEEYVEEVGEVEGLVLGVAVEGSSFACEFSSPSNTMSETLRGDRDLVPLRRKLDEDDLSLPRFCSYSRPSFLRFSSIAAANGSKSLL